ncbi:glycoside hydrolase superfamily [Amylocarpus encephaloides]|uniref:chitinase n=1 Tax=Amylocarpus encephaloides TaxID=45428 RepID=A0A9P8BZA5_9HELO|nr:glycoside hydrolase superfamily [Amylocarpus encephaloides]
MQNSTYRTMLYYSNCFLPENMPLDQLTHILYAFANVNPLNGEVFLSNEWVDTQMPISPTGSFTWLRGALGQLFELKRRHRNLKVLLSIGGYDNSDGFALAAMSPGSRAAFGSSAVHLVANLGLDGAQNYILLLQALRAALDQYSNSLQTRYHFEITVACSAEPEYYTKLIIAEMDPFIDSWNLMAYDYSGAWSSIAAHQSNIFLSKSASTLFDTESAANYYLSKGIPRGKITIGMPLFGRTFRGTEGIGQSYKDVGPKDHQGVYSVYELPLPGSVVVYDKAVGASYCWHPVSKELISYDSPEVAVQKAQWIQDRGLGGIMWWEAFRDYSGEDSLIRISAGALSALQQTENMLDYPESTYANESLMQEEYFSRNI